jgi:hypothetical protein
METNFIREYYNALPKRECEKLIHFFEATVNSGNIYVSKGEVDNGGGVNRADEAIYLEKVSLEINEKINEIVGACWEKYLEEFPFLSDFAVASHTSKMQKTKPRGGFHTWHWEHKGTNHQYRNRMATWTLYLTGHEDEGETEFLAHGLKVKPEAGKFCIFPADYTAVHRGNPVYSKNKYIITGWYEYHDTGA